ncbi:hypothetical protein [Micromonospora sp. NPDC005652]|uniref:hypothetical protein n=1 Tax=Micromonospora sp. NPDC005652 TaxID=3157046 RepID=UPI0033ECDAD2
MTQMTGSRPTGAVYDAAAAARVAVDHPDAGPGEIAKRARLLAGEDSLQALVDKVWEDCLAVRGAGAPTDETIWGALLAAAGADPALANAGEAYRAAAAGEWRSDPALLAAVHATWARAQAQVLVS